MRDLPQAQGSRRSAERVGGLDELKGRGKEALGGLSGNEETQAEGQTDQMKGQGQQALGNLKDAAGNLMDKVKGSNNS